jgi:hypothetical protein
VCGIVGRQIDREAGFDSRSDKGPVLDSDRIVAEDGLVGEGDCVLAGVGGDELVEERAVDLGPVSGEIACLGIAPETAGPQRCDLSQNSDQDLPARPLETRLQWMARAPVSA